ncbi:DUF3179 domain-containing protein, partial [Patescibacteria group bacterium]|nr:DUF3179 domain-containing protein [Patescibacteria group bacterium]
MKKRKLQVFGLIALALAGITVFVTRGIPVSRQSDVTVNGVPIIQDVPKDAIPPLDFPQYQTVQEAIWIKEDDIILGIDFDGDARAYPTKILNWHEIVNEKIADREIVVTYCPLCNTAISFDRRFDGLLLDFGTTGRLRHSDLIMYDRQTETWWQQAIGEGIVGE